MALVTDCAEMMPGNPAARAEALAAPALFTKERRLCSDVVLLILL
jgi:hypothetical protein